MKKKITKLMAVVVFGLFYVFNINAQTKAYEGTYPITMTGVTQVHTNPVADGWAGTSSAPTSASRNGKCFATATDANFNSGKNLTYWLPNCGTLTIQANGTSGRGFIITVVKAADNTQLSRTVWAYDNATCSTTDIVVNSSEAVKITILSPSSAEAPITTTGSSYVSYVNITAYEVASPRITAFTAEGVSATIDQDTKTITAELPYGTNLTAITPAVTIGGTATGYTPAGTQDFSAGTVIYTVTDGVANVNYNVTLTANPTPSSDKDITNLTIGGATPTFDSGTNAYSIMLAKGSSLSQTVTFDIPATASAAPASGTTLDLSTTQTITVTAQDNSTKAYTVSATVANNNIAYVINTAVSANDTKIRAALAESNQVVNIKVADITTSYDFSNYDLVVLTESPSSGSAGMKALWGINKPLLALKMYAVNSNTWNQGTGANPAPAATTVVINEPNHPIFTGITPTGTYNNEIQAINSISSGNGLQTSNYASDYLIGGISGATGVSIAEFPVGQTSSVSGVTNEALQQRVLVLGISDNNQQNLTADGITLVKNACNYLTGATVWGADAGTLYNATQVTGGSSSNVTATTATISWSALPATVKYVVTSASGPFSVKRAENRVKAAINLDVNGTDTSYNLSDLTPETDYTFSVVGENAIGVASDAATISFKTPKAPTGLSSARIDGVMFDGKIIRNAKQVNVSLFDISGRFILSSNQDIDMTGKAKGVYIVKSGSGIMKINQN